MSLFSPVEPWVTEQSGSEMNQPRPWGSGPADLQQQCWEDRKRDGCGRLITASAYVCCCLRSVWVGEARLWQDPCPRAVKNVRCHQESSLKVLSQDQVVRQNQINREARERDSDQEDLEGQRRGSPSPGREYADMTPYPPSPAPTLPFSLLRQQALLRAGPSQATSHIFYEPDAYDDLDQEDPDDDLDV